MQTYLLLALIPIAGAVGNLAQSVAATRTDRLDRIDPGLLGRLARDPMYLFGFGAQVVGFVLAFLARATMPLYVVQSASSAAIGVTAVLGALLMRWRLSNGEIVALLVVASGLILLVASSVPSAAEPLSSVEVGVLVAALVCTAGVAVPVSRTVGPRAAVALGALSGVSFGILAVVSRPLAARVLIDLPRQLTFWIMILCALLGQSLLAAALQRCATTATAAAMESTAVVLASVVGLWALGDRFAPGRGPWVAFGLAAVVSGVAGLVAVVRAQHISVRSADSDSSLAEPLAGEA
jgi:drug/metabolite transporter (DMT)-like permease